MSDKPENPPAFPVCTDFSRVNDGMTLRDWFAGQALMGRNVTPRAYKRWEDLAADCYEQADAMLAARAKQP